MSKYAYVSRALYNEMVKEFGAEFIPGWVRVIEPAPKLSHVNVKEVEARLNERRPEKSPRDDLIEGMRL